MSFVETYVIRTQANSVIQDDNFRDSNAFTTMQNVGRIVSGAAVLFGIIAATEVSFNYLAVKETRSSVQKYIIKLLAGHMLSMLGSNLVIFALSIARFADENWQQCSIFGSLPIFLYFVSHCFNYFILIQRAKLARLSSVHVFRVLFVIAKFGGFLALLLTMSTLSFVRGVILPNRVCVYSYPWKVALVLSLLDCALGTVYLLLFLLSLQKYLRTLREMEDCSDSASRYVTMARTNLKWGGISILSSSFLLFFATTLQALNGSHENSGGSTNYSFHLVDSIVAPCDMCINLLAALKITQQTWRPPGSTSPSIIQLPYVKHPNVVPAPVESDTI